jgi:hypothetical protein
MVGRTLHSSGLVPNCLAAQVLDFIAQGRLGLLGLAAAAGVVSAECRFNHWVATHLKKAALNELQWMRLLEADERNADRCRTAMAAFKSGGSLETLCAELSAVAAWLNQRSFEAMAADVKPILPTVHRVINVEVRGNGSLAATFEADGGGQRTLFLPIKIAVSSSRQMERVGYRMPTLFECDPTTSVWLSWDDAGASASSRDLKSRQGAEPPPVGPSKRNGERRNHRGPPSEQTGLSLRRFVSSPASPPEHSCVTTGMPRCRSAAACRQCDPQ